MRSRLEQVIRGFIDEASVRAKRQQMNRVRWLHNHLLTADPQVFYLHFWAHDDPIKLAKGLRAALDKTNSAKPST